MPSVKITGPTRGQSFPLGPIQVTGTATGDIGPHPGHNPPPGNQPWPVDGVTIQIGSATVQATLSNYSDALNRWDFAGAVTPPAAGSPIITVTADVKRPGLPGEPPVESVASSTVQIIASPWQDQQPMPGNSSVGPSLAAYNNQLYAAWMGDNQQVFWATFNGTQWSGTHLLSGVGSSHGPSLAVHNNLLYAAWKGLAADTDQGMYWSTFNGTTWSDQQKMPVGESSVGPALAEFNGRLYAAWKGMGGDQRLFWSALC